MNTVSRRDLPRSERQATLVLRLRGGLGNQFFEYAAGRALALRNRVPLWLDATSGFKGDRYGRSYELSGFNVRYEGIEPVSSLGLGLRADFLRRFLNRRELLKMRFGRYFDAGIYHLRINRPTVIDAYCQSYRYFSGVEDLVRTELEFKTIPAGLDDGTVSDITRGNSVCLHVRRLFAKEVDGTIRQSVKEFYGTCDLAYYRHAIEETAAMHGRLKIFVFSDDTRWAFEHARAFEVAGCSVRVIDENSLRSFYLMRLCRHFIIANSTYSWWAAWLGGGATKTVCVPPVWKRGESRFPKDLIPSTWRIIPGYAPATRNIEAV